MGVATVTAGTTGTTAMAIVIATVTVIGAAGIIAVRRSEML
jgi:hypothetical protein